MTNSIDIKLFISHRALKIDHLSGSAADRAAKLGKLETSVEKRILYVRWYTKHYSEITKGTKTAADFDPAETDLAQVAMHEKIEQAYAAFKSKASEARASFPPAAPKSRLIEYIPFAGLAAGMASGVASRLSDTGLLSSFGEKSKELCRKAFANAPFLRGINALKQLEIKHFALLTPLIPLATKIIADAVRSGNPNGILAKLKDAAGRNLTRAQLVSLALIGTGMLCNTVSSRLFGSFDASGHMMLKTLLAQFLSLGLAQTADAGGKLAQAAAGAFGALYASTDAVLVHNTMRACHTVAETAAGVGLGLGLLGIGKAIPKS